MSGSATTDRTPAGAGSADIGTSPRASWTIGGAAATGLASAAAAAVAGLCCVGPVTVALLGAGGAVAAAGLKPYRLPLLIVSAAFVAAGFWRTYKPASAPGVACPVRVGRLVQGGLWIAAVLWIAAATLFLVE